MIRKYWIWLLDAVVLLLILYAVLFPQGAHAANQPHWKLDAAVTAVAGKPVAAFCEVDSEHWADRIRTNFGPAQSPSLLLGYTLLSNPIVYLSPRVCIALKQALERGITLAGAYPVSLALNTLAHEAVHQRGVINEAVTECLANRYVRTLAVAHFGVPVKVTVKRIVRVSGRLVTRTVMVANPLLTRLTELAKYWTSTKPAQYRGGVC
jgi:hypothetical protein